MDRFTQRTFRHHDVQASWERMSKQVSLAFTGGNRMKGFFLIRYLLAGSSVRRVRNLYRLAKHSSSKIRQHVAENSVCPVGLLALLSTDEYPEVRMAVALNRNTDLETLMFLSKDESPDVRFRIASASYMFLPVLEALTADDNPYVSARARRTLSRLCSKNMEATNKWKK